MSQLGSSLGGLCLLFATELEVPQKAVDGDTFPLEQWLDDGRNGSLNRPKGGRVRRADEETQTKEFLLRLFLTTSSLLRLVALAGAAGLIHSPSSDSPWPGLNLRTPCSGISSSC